MKYAATRLSFPFLGLALALPVAAIESTEDLQRASGLWKVTLSTSPFSWEICVDHGLMS